MELATKSVSFNFNDTMYRRVDGISMGSRLGPLLVNVFVGVLEQQLYEKVHKPYCYVCYVDDTFACFPSHNEALKLLLWITFILLWLTMEEENDNMMPFLDVLGEKGHSSFITSIYRLANSPGDRGSIPSRVIPKTLKMVLDTSFLHTQQYKVRIKGKVEQSWERSSTLPYALV